MASAMKKSMTGYVVMQDTAEASGRLPCIQTQRRFSLLLLRQVFRKVEDFEHSREVHVSLVRRCVRSMLDLHDFHIDMDMEQIGSAGKGDRMTWKDFRMVADNGAIPQLELTLPQQVHMVLEHQDSICGMLWFVLTNIAIIVNIVLIAAVSMPEVQDLSFFKLLLEAEHACVYFFIVDYVLKLGTVVFCPIAMCDERWLLHHVAPDAEVSHSHSKFERFTHFFFAPANFVDVISISPTLLHVLFKSRLPLSALRMLRLLRVFRVLKSFKALGKWVVELQVLGEAFYNSLGTVAVLIIYMWLLAMLAGAIINSQDASTDPVFDTLPMSMWYVVARFVGMQKTLAMTDAIPIAPLSAFVMVCIGLFKGVLFLLPIDRLKNATKAAEKYHKEIADMSAEVEQETRRLSLPPSVVWSEDASCPVVRIEIFRYGEELGGPTGECCGLVKCPVPLLCESKEATKLLVPVLGPSLRRLFGAAPLLEVAIDWVPAAPEESSDTGAVRVPRGTLGLQLLRGSSFRDVGARLCCRLEVPSSLYGSRASDQWTSGPSDKASQDLSWSAGNSKSFQIAWEAPAAKQMHATPASQFEHQVTELLAAQALQIKGLEEVVDQMKSKSVR